MQEKQSEFQIIMKIYFNNDFDVDKITELLNLKPSYCTPYSKSGYTRKSNQKQLGAWWYSYPSPTEFEKEMVLQNVLDKFFEPFDKGKIQILKKIVEENSGEIKLGINIYFYHERVPELCFGGQAMRILNYLNADIEINMNEDNEC